MVFIIHTDFARGEQGEAKEMPKVKENKKKKGDCGEQGRRRKPRSCTHKSVVAVQNAKPSAEV